MKPFPTSRCAALVCSRYRPQAASGRALGRARGESKRYQEGTTAGMKSGDVEQDGGGYGPEDNCLVILGRVSRQCQGHYQCPPVTVSPHVVLASLPRLELEVLRRKRIRVGI